MNILDPISTIMTPNPIAVGVNDPLSVVDKLFREHKIHHLPVVVEGKLAGMVSKSDYLFFRRGFTTDETEKIEEEVRMNNYTVGDIMTSKLAKLEPTDKINVALEVFRENIFHALPVVDGDRLVGIVTTFDIIDGLASDSGATAEYN
ncbi:MAG: CBS domain-containing protein [Saprospiraceae bacterium]|nr:MAG: Hypoxic response protein 1 [Bacteroidetes bacterium OLB9]MCO6463049.1 CBS domain-containing protein [Saprospiraceae bacterium]MCZ2337147.1 CBS domain-containing protein [Chitinophagales bacterium]